MKAENGRKSVFKARDENRNGKRLREKVCWKAENGSKGQKKCVHNVDNSYKHEGCL
jgi:hypothetical protein